MAEVQNGNVAGATEDHCPVCKASTFFEKNLLFKINTKCYHRICDGCVTRVTEAGKKCPIPGCPFAARGVLARKVDYREQTFEDLGIEREVDVRRRVMGILNRREEEFASSRDWDDFLERREEIIMNLVLKTDVKNTEAALASYKAKNHDAIKASTNKDRIEANHRDTRRHAPPVVFARTGDAGVSISDPTGLVKGLQKVKPRPVAKPYDPFMGMATGRDYYELRTDYPSLRLKSAKADLKIKAGGFDFQAYFDENLLRAFAGLGCFIDEEKT